MAWHYLRGNMADYGPQHIICVDTETSRVSVDGRQQCYRETFRLGVASYTACKGGFVGRQSLFAFQSTADFWQWAASKLRPRQTVWLFAHNLGFDSRTLGLFGELDAGTFTRRVKRRRTQDTKTGQRRSEWRHGLLVTADPPVIIECWHANGGLLRCIDTMNYWPTSLAKVGRWVGIEKLPMPDPWEPDDAWLDYCRRDTEILTAAVLRYIAWCRDNGCGMFSMTLPSQAMHAYRHSAACGKICIHDESDVRQLEGEAHLGGEVYVGFVGRVGSEQNDIQLDWLEARTNVVAAKSGPVHQLDSNSLFPSVMAHHLFPTKLVDWHIGTNGSRSLVSEMGPDCIAECLVRCGGDGCYSRRRARSGRYTGVFVAVLAGPELVEWLKVGAVVAVRRYARYELSDLFSNWVEIWWQRRWMARLAGDDFAADMAKKIMNSLYGKFAQRSYSWTDAPDRVPRDRWGWWFEADATTGDVQNWRAIAGTAQRQFLDGYHPKSFPAIAAFVCSYAREKMRRLRQVAGYRHVYYQGIDSLYVDETGWTNLTLAGEIDPAALGKLRHEDTADTADFLGWGLYRIGDRWCRTSVARGAIECRPGEFDQQNFERLEAALMRSPEAGVLVNSVHRSIKASSPVGIIGRDGWVSPLPAQWGDNPAETVDPRGYYGADMGHVSDDATTAAVH